MHALVTKLETSMNHGNDAICFFGDIEGAFNHTSFQMVMEALGHWNILSPVKFWLYNMLSNHIATVCLSQTECHYCLNQGLSQGGAIAATLWLIVLDPLLKKLSNLHTLVILHMLMISV